MSKIKVYNIEGQAAGEMEVSEKVFGLPANDELVHQAYVSIYANNRTALAHTKTRGERAGSGIKPWRQKGTGRARVGSVRTPVWKKGGVVFGPRSDRNFKKDLNAKMKSLAIKTVLSGKLKNEEIIVLDKLDLKEKKTKEFARILKNLKVKSTSLIAFAPEEKDLRLFSRNLEKADNILSSQLNVFEMLNHKNLIMSKESVNYLEKKYK